MSSVSTAILATSVFLTTFAGLGAGYLMAPPPVRSGDSRPIIDPDAWNKTGPVAPAFQAQAQPVAVNSAMNVASDSRNARGWVPPDDVVDASYQEAPRDNASVSGDTASYAVEQLDGAGPGDRGSTRIMVLDKAEADRAWDSAPAPSISEPPTETLPAPSSR